MYSWFTRLQWWLSIVLLVYQCLPKGTSFVRSSNRSSFWIFMRCGSWLIEKSPGTHRWNHGSLLFFIQKQNTLDFTGFLGFPEISLPSSKTPWSLVSCLVPFPFPWPPRPHQDWTMFDPRSPVTAGHGPQANGWSMRTCSTMNKHPF